MEIRIWGGVIELCGDMAISITLYWSRFRPGLSQSFRGVIELCGDMAISITIYWCSVSFFMWSAALESKALVFFNHTL